MCVGGLYSRAAFFVVICTVNCKALQKTVQLKRNNFFIPRIYYMKIPTTEQFLWDVYNTLEKAVPVADFILKPRAAKLFGMENPIFRKYQKEMGRRGFGRLVYYLKTKNYITTENVKGVPAVILTKRGISKALKASFNAGDKKKRKDGKWIMLTFDIPQQHKKARQLLRSIIRNLGYNMFQQSIWICPYDVSEITEKLLQEHNLEKYVKIFLIESL